MSGMFEVYQDTEELKPQNEGTAKAEKSSQHLCL